MSSVKNTFIRLGGGIEVEMKVIMATGNANKVREIRQMLNGTGIEVVSMKEAGADIDIEETGASFEENAKIKAETIARITGQVTIADDSGLSIDALNGEPGVHSARFMGEETPYAVKCNAILDKMKDVPKEKRGARFSCAMCVSVPAVRNGETAVTSKVFLGVMEGEIGYEMKGENGFGYDPVFVLPEYNKTSAEISPEEKNAISHRGKALKMVVQELTKNS